MYDCILWLQQGGEREMMKAKFHFFSLRRSAIHAGFEFFLGVEETMKKSVWRR